MPDHQPFPPPNFVTPFDARPFTAMTAAENIAYVLGGFQPGAIRLMRFILTKDELVDSGIMDGFILTLAAGDMSQQVNIVLSREHVQYLIAAGKDQLENEPDEWVRGSDAPGMWKEGPVDTSVLDTPDNDKGDDGAS